ncbi:HRDC domain-containing protein [Rothia sp. ZJ932]|uniref:HRDC domain-containing protein n=1 Tax=Rothia sp. ZJ932 TaxID=2810516 RepID=UPI0019673DD8|nr:HRDC domain-containing protein [Rothia sp. ZJ932]QRZ60873.1 ribonuclease D [Rothia sp. ZJ932]
MPAENLSVVGSNTDFGLPAGVTIPELVPLDEPFDGVPALITNERGLARAAERLVQASGPVAVDTERASGVRYGQRAFLVQIKRGESGVILIDPECFSDLGIINVALSHTEWVLHAAGQDLVALAKLGMQPDQLFDTELAGRLAGFERVGLGTVVEKLLGYKLAKEHSAADWSRRPLPKSWLNYAALDVEILTDLRDAFEDVLREQGKWEYALQEFEYLRLHPVKEKRKDPWRKTKGIQRLKNRRQLTALRNLWLEREHLAQKKDVAPKKLLPDASIIEAAYSMPSNVPAVLSIPGFQTRALKREAPRWVRAIVSARNDKEPVPYTTPAEGPPPLKAWEVKRPLSAQLIAPAKEAMAALSEKHSIPTENLLTPEILRRVCWDPPVNAHSIADALRQLDARPWQVELVTPVLSPIFNAILGEHR